MCALKQGVLEKTIREVSHSLEAALFAEEVASRPGFLQRLDPHIKLATFLALILAVALTRELALLALFYLLALALAVSAHIPLGLFLKRVWLFIPLFTGIIAIPALFNPFTPGRPLITLWEGVSLPWWLPLPGQLAITEPGVRTASLLVLRVSTSVSFVVLLVLTTRWPSLLKALRLLRVPQAFVVILGMTYRYVALLLHTVEAMFISRRSRTVRRLEGSQERRWLARTLTALLAKSYYLSQDVHLAMVSRGFRGEALTMDSFAPRSRDWAWSGFVGLFLLLIYWLH